MRSLKITKRITPSDSILDMYLRDISKDSDLITFNEEVELAKRIKKGDHNAFEKLTKANLRFVVSVAKQYQNQGLSLPDLINEGNMGLTKAALRFDETRGFKFISYAVWWIRQSILQALSEQSTIIRLPPNKFLENSNIKKAKAELEQKLEREPSYEEIAGFLEIPEHKVKSTIRSSYKPLSLDDPVFEDEDETIGDSMKNESPPTDNGLINESLHKEVLRVLNTLPEREKKVIRLYYGFETEGVPMSFYQIGERMDLTAEMARKIKVKAIRRLKNSSRSKILKPYLG